jgi:hypothetical protein
MKAATRNFAKSEIWQLFKAFETAHKAAAVAPYDERVSDAQLTKLWARVRSARAAFISKLMERADDYV